MNRETKKRSLFWHQVFLAVLVITLGAYSGAFAGGGHHGHWSYEGETGPAHWGGLSEKFSACSEGKSQSPIDIRDAAGNAHGQVKFHYGPTEIRIINNGHTVQVNYDKGSYIEVGGVRYNLLQFHFHGPSEHTVAGAHADMEMHLVHKNDKGALAVVGVMIENGSLNKAFKGVWSNLPEEEGKEKLVKVSVNASDLLPAKRSYYSYSGSLTTPPCSEKVLWIVLKNPVRLSVDQIKAFKKVVGFENNRPVQPLNGRRVVEVEG